MADAVDPAELLDVDVDQLARPLALVADDLGLGLERRQPAEPVPAQDQAHGGDRSAQPPRDRRPGQALAAQRQDLGLGRLVQPRRAGDAAASERSAQAGLALRGMPGPPLAHRLGA